MVIFYSDKTTRIQLLQFSHFYFRITCKVYMAMDSSRNSPEELSWSKNAENTIIIIVFSLSVGFCLFSLVLIIVVCFFVVMDQAARHKDKGIKKYSPLMLNVDVEHWCWYCFLISLSMLSVGVCCCLLMLSVGHTLSERAHMITVF